jgi:hypothetical protein
MAERRRVPCQCGTAAGRHLLALHADGHHLGNRHVIRLGHVVKVLRHINYVSEALYLKGISNFTVTHFVALSLAGVLNKVANGSHP